MVRVFPLKYVDVGEMAHVVRQALGEDLDPRSITNDQGTNSLTISADERTLNRLAYLISQYDRPEPVFVLQPEASERVVRVIKLEHGEAKLVAETISRLYPLQGSDLAEMITAQADKDGRLLLSYSPLKEAEIMALVKQLDAPAPAETTFFRVFAVKPADHGRVRQKLAEMAAESGIFYRVGVGRASLIVAADAVAIEKVAGLIPVRPPTAPSINGASTAQPSVAGVKGVVRLPDGSPAAGARVALSSGRNIFQVLNGKLERQTYDYITETGANGRYAFPPQENPFAIVAIHEDGWRLLSSKDIPASGEIVLQAWARIEGIARIGDRPAAGAEIHVNYGMGPGSTFVQYDTKTDENGRFSFARVPPGNGSICRAVWKRTGSFASNPRFGFIVDPGKTLAVNLGGEGRPVVGRLSAPRDDDVDWQWNSSKLTPKREDSAPSALMVSGLKPLARWADSFNLNSDGSFRVEDVPAGTYVLEASVYQPPPDGDSRKINFEKIVGTVKVEFVVPPIPGGRSDEPLDLGDLPLGPEKTIAPASEATEEPQKPSSTSQPDSSAATRAAASRRTQPRRTARIGSDENAAVQASEHPEADRSQRAIYQMAGSGISYPGPYRVPQETGITLVQAIAAAGGRLRTDKTDQQIRMFRGPTNARKIIDLELESILAGDAPDPAIQPGDFIYVGQMPPSTQPARRAGTAGDSAAQMSNLYNISSAAQQTAELLEEAVGADWTADAAPHVKVLPSTNQILVTGTPDQIKWVEKWLAKHEKAEPGQKGNAATGPASEEKSERVVRVIRLEHSKPEDVAETIARLYPRSQAADPADMITVEPSNDGQLLLSYSPSREEEILAVIKQLDQAATRLPEGKLVEVMERLEQDKTVEALNELLKLNNARIARITEIGHPMNSAGIRDVQRIRSAGREYVAVVARRRPKRPDLAKLVPHGWGVAFFFRPDGVLEGHLGGEAGEDHVHLTTLGTLDQWFCRVSRSEERDPFTYSLDVHLVTPGLPRAFRVYNHPNSTAWTGKPDTRPDVPFQHFFWFHDGNDKSEIQWGDLGIAADGKPHDMLVGWDPQTNRFRGASQITFKGKPVYQIDLALSPVFEPTDVANTRPAPGSGPKPDTQPAAQPAEDANPGMTRVRFVPDGADDSAGASFTELGPSPQPGYLVASAWAGIGEKFPVRRDGRTLFEVFVLAGDDDRVILKLRTKDTAEQAGIQRQQAARFTVDGKTYSLAYPSLWVNAGGKSTTSKARLEVWCRDEEAGPETRPASPVQTRPASDSDLDNRTAERTPATSPASDPDKTGRLVPSSSRPDRRAAVPADDRLPAAELAQAGKARGTSWSQLGPIPRPGVLWMLGWAEIGEKFPIRRDDRVLFEVAVVSSDEDRAAVEVLSDGSSQTLELPRDKPVPVQVAGDTYDLRYFGLGPTKNLAYIDISYRLSDGEANSSAEPGIVYLTGKVQRPGTYKAKATLTLGQAIAAAGGLTPQLFRRKATCEISRLADTKSMSRIVDLDAILTKKVADLEIQPNDLLTVAYDGRAATDWREELIDLEPNTTEMAILRARGLVGQYYVSGLIMRPGAYALSGAVLGPDGRSVRTGASHPVTLRRAIACAGGIDELTPDGPLSCVVRRRHNQPSERMIVIDDLNAIMGGSRPDVEILPNDIIHIKRPRAQNKAAG
jgi:protein involved in polysaccharide export with SLBB domain